MAPHEILVERDRVVGDVDIALFCRVRRGAQQEVCVELQSWANSFEVRAARLTHALEG